MGVAFALLLALFLVFAEGDFRVSAKTVVEGAVQRAAVAPFEGFIAEAPVRAGDTVRAGQLLVRLEDRDLRLERVKLVAERDQQLRKYHDALAKHDRPAAGILMAQAGQSAAQIALVDEKIARTRVTAPSDGVVVSGDLSQLLGSPVEQGKLLFEIAPLDAYRIILKVDDRDIAFVVNGQHGRLVLSGLGGDPLRFQVSKVTPVSTPQEGHNYFRVEAQLESPRIGVRPGMEGVGKIIVDHRKLAWIWTRGLIDWMRITFWTWMP
jgi:multidrug resistance efflux pump